MMALENDDASARAASVAKKKALRDATKASAIDAASSIDELTGSLGYISTRRQPLRIKDR